MNFHSWLKQKKNHFGIDVVDDTPELLKKIWSVEIVINDKRVSEEDIIEAKEERKLLLEPKILVLLQKIYQIDATSLLPEDTSADTYFTYKSLLYRKQKAKKVIDNLRHKYPNLLEELPPPSVHIEKSIDRYKETFQEFVLVRKKQDTLKAEINLLNKRASLLAIETQSFVYPYDLNKMIIYKKKLTQEILEQNAFVRQVEKITSRANELNLKINIPLPPYNKEIIHQLEQNLTRKEEEIRKIKEIVNRAKHVQYDLEDADLSVLYIRNRIILKVEERESLVNLFRALEKKYDAIGDKKTFLIKEMSQESLLHAENEYTNQETLYEQWKQKVKNHDSFRVTLNRPITKTNMDLLCAKLDFDKRWREKVQEQYDGTPFRAPKLSNLIDQEEAVSIAAQLKEDEKKIIRWRKIKRLKERFYFLIQTIWNKTISFAKTVFSLIFLQWSYYIPKSLYQKERFFLLFLYILVIMQLVIIPVEAMYLYYNTNKALYSFEEASYYTMGMNSAYITIFGTYLQYIMHFILCHDWFRNIIYGLTILIILGTEGVGCILLIILPIIYLLIHIFAWICMSVLLILTLPTHIAAFLCSDVDIFSIIQDYPEQIYLYAGAYEVDLAYEENYILLKSKLEHLLQ